MTRMFVLVSLIAMRLGEATPPTLPPAPASPCGTVAPTVGSTTPAPLCDTPLCKGLVGAGAGLAGLAAIGGIASALAPKHATTLPPVITTTRQTKPIATPQSTTANPLFRQKDEPKKNNWLLPLLLGLLALCCCLGLMAYLMKPKSKRATKVTKKKTKAPAPESRNIAVAPVPEAAPLMGHYEQPMQNVAGHYEQPMQTVPVTTAQTSYVPAVVSPRAMAAPTYARQPVAPTYAMAAPTYAREPVAPRYAMAAPTHATQGYSMPGSATSGVVPGYSTGGFGGFQ
jgi:hypothetical protein